MKWKCLENLNNLHYDVVVLSVPWTTTNIPLMAPAILKSTAEQVGKSCLAVDLNMEVLDYGSQHPKKNELINFFFEEKLNEIVEDDVYDIFYSAAQQILSFTPQWVGISVFSYLCQTSAKWLAYFIRKLDPNIKIVFGGPGCMLGFTGHSEFIIQLRDMNLIDYHIRGDAEISFRELLMGNDKYPGINDLTWKEMTNEELESLPVPNFDDYDFSQYKTGAIPILASRGCVRKCTFCDFISNWPNFRWRKAENVYEEIMTQVQKYDIRWIKFQDALINGNQKEFFRLCELLADYNEKNPEKSLKWGSFFIFREHHKNSDHEWDLIKKSGADMLAVGVENFNQHIRYAIGKKFSDEAIIYHLEQAQKHKIQINLLHITGYINETQKDVDNVKQWLRDNTRFRDTINFYWGSGLGIFENTYLYQNKKTLGIRMIGPNPHEWISDHTESTPQMRLKWTKEYMDLSKELGYVNLDGDTDMHYLLERFSK